MKFVGHRGASHVLPELTMAAITKALALGVSFECDLQVLRSGEVVLLHDDTLERTAAPWSADCGFEEEAYKTLITTPAASLSLAEVSSVDVGSWFDAAHREERVPLFSQALDALKESREASSKCCFAELKSVVEEDGGTGPIPEIDRQLVVAADAIARAHELLPEQLVWISFSLAVAAEIKKRDPMHASLLIRCGARALASPRNLTQRPCLHQATAHRPLPPAPNTAASLAPRRHVRSAEDAWQAARDCVEHGLDGIDLNADQNFVTAELAEWLRERNKVLAVWVFRAPAVNDTPEVWPAMRDIGTAYFTSNLPPQLEEWRDGSAAPVLA